MDQGYHINVAKATGMGNRFGSDEPARAHYCKVFVGDTSQGHAIAMLLDTRERYPLPEFECTMTLWRFTGTNIDAG